MPIGAVCAALNDGVRGACSGAAAAARIESVEGDRPVQTCDCSRGDSFAALPVCLLASPQIVVINGSGLCVRYALPISPRHAGVSHHRVHYCC